MLKSGKQTEQQIDKTLDSCLHIFRLVQGKDVFEACYAKFLARRLLLGKSASVDDERRMVGKLRLECGAGFTSKMEGMFKDMDVSREVMSGFNESARYREKISSIGIEFGVHVLTSGYWPTYPQISLNLPVDLSKCQEAYKGTLLHF